MTQKETSVFDLVTDTKKETEGVWCDFGPFAFKLRRIGSSNVAFAKMLDATLMKPYRTAIDAGTMDNDLAQKLLVTCFCKTVLVNWRRTDNGKHTEGVMPDGKGGNIEFNLENAVDVFLRVRSAFDGCMEFAKQLEHYTQDEIADTAKN